MIVRVNDHVSRSLSVEDHNLLMMGNRLPSPARNPDLLSFDCCHIHMVADQYGSVRNCTAELAGLTQRLAGVVKRHASPRNARQVVPQTGPTRMIGVGEQVEQLENDQENRLCQARILPRDED
jgi:hypothetical protein